MAKYSAFGTLLQRGLAQIETATVIGTIINPGNAAVTITCVGMTGTGSPINVAVAAADTASAVGGKIRALLALNASVIAKFYISGSGATVILTRKIAAANDNTMNIAIDNSTCSGLTPAPTSTNTQGGVAYATIAQVQNFGGPKLSTDTIDVTAHDSSGGWEESIATILRSGEVTMDILYDPAEATHYASAGGLLDDFENRNITHHKMTFPTTPPASWLFDGIVTGFELAAPFDGALTASVTVKVTGAPVIAPDTSV